MTNQSERATIHRSNDLRYGPSFVRLFPGRMFFFAFSVSRCLCGGFLHGAQALGWGTHPLTPSLSPSSGLKRERVPVRAGEGGVPQG